MDERIISFLNENNLTIIRCRWKKIKSKNKIISLPTHDLNWQPTGTNQSLVPVGCAQSLFILREDIWKQPAIPQDQLSSFLNHQPNNLFGNN